MISTSAYRRILLYGMQSSGASYVAWCLSQERDRIAILDLHRPVVAPAAEEFGGQKALVKATVDTEFSLADSIENYRPDCVILVVRDEAAVRESILRHEQQSIRIGTYLLRGAKDMDRKLRRMRAALKSDLYDKVVRYKEFAAIPRKLERSLEEIVRHNHEHCPWCRPNRMSQRWGIGGIHRPAEMSEAEWRWLTIKLVRRYGRFAERYHPAKARRRFPNPYQRVASEA